MELKAGLAGQLLTGLASELEVRLYATGPIQGELEIEDGSGLGRLSVQLDERKARIIHLPVTPDRFSPVRVRWRGAQVEPIEREVSFEPIRRPLMLVASSIPSFQNFDSHRLATETTPLILSAEGLPNLAQTYASVEALVMDQQTLSRLSDKQFRALADYLGRCGLMLLHNMDPDSLRRTQQIAGCAGRYVESFTNLSQAPPLLQRLSAQMPPKPPSAADLLTLQETNQRQQMVRALSLFLLGYLVLSSLSVWRLHKIQLFLLLPLLASGAALLAWSGPSRHTLVSWSESESGDHSVRTYGLLSVGGDRRGENSLEPGEGFQLSLPHRASVSDTIDYLESGDIRRLVGHTPLLVQQHYPFSSLTRRENGVRLLVQAQNPQVSFQHQGASTQAKLIWHDQVFDLPTLAEGEPWRPDQDQGRAPATAAERLLCRRLAFEDAALLLPHTTPNEALPFNTAQSTGWLVIRSVAGGL